MNPIPQLSSRDVVLICSPQLIGDGVWREEYGREVEYRFRVIPMQLAYLSRKYGIVPHWFFVDSIAEVCDVGKERADELITEALRIGLISDKTPAADRRQKLYYLTQEQVRKLLRVRAGEANAYRLADVQSKDPDNPCAGLTEENRPWYRNVMQRVEHWSEENKKDAQKLEKFRHLLAALIVLILFSWPSLVWATMAGGTK